MKSLDNWNPQSLDTNASANDPLVEQINIIKGYVKQARDAMRFEEVRNSFFLEWCLRFTYRSVAVYLNHIFKFMLFV